MCSSLVWAGVCSQAGKAGPGEGSRLPWARGPVTAAGLAPRRASRTTVRHRSSADRRPRPCRWMALLLGSPNGSLPSRRPALLPSQQLCPCPPLPSLGCQLGTVPVWQPAVQPPGWGNDRGGERQQSGRRGGPAGLD